MNTPGICPQTSTTSHLNIHIHSCSWLSPYIFLIEILSKAKLHHLRIIFLVSKCTQNIYIYNNIGIIHLTSTRLMFYWILQKRNSSRYFHSKKESIIQHNPVLLLLLLLLFYALRKYCGWKCWRYWTTTTTTLHIGIGCL